MNYKKLELENPFAEGTALKVKLGGTSGYYGACSIENYSGISSNLRRTHEDAEGFLDYPTRFKPANFWRKDGDVKVWKYEEQFDNWQNLYGMDAVNVFYHSGHGYMYSDGVFKAPMGGYWDNRAHVYSNRMAFANEKLRYLFWSTCLGLRVLNGHSPIRTWSPANKGGIRMIFGYETISYDNSNYGKYFWEEWRRGETLTNSFLAASRRISQEQTPVVCAMGANRSDAESRLNNERYFYSTPVSNNYWSWEWINAFSGFQAPAMSKMVEPKNNDALILSSQVANDEFLSAIARKVGITQRTSGIVRFDEVGNRQIGTQKIKVNLSNKGDLNLELARANYRNDQVISENKAVDIAKDLISDLGLDKGIELVQGTTFNTFIGGGNAKTEKLDDTRIVETTIQFRQVHNKAESVNSGSGLVTVSIDNDGKVTQVFSSLKKIEDVQKQANIVEIAKARGVDYQATSREEQFAQKIHQIISGAMPQDGKLLSTKQGEKVEKPSVKIIDEKIGYDFSSNFAKPVHQRDVEIQFGEFAKRYKLRVDI